MTVWERAATDHASEAAASLRIAAQIADPYRCGDAIWEAVEWLRRAELHLSRSRGRWPGLSAAVDQLERICESSGEPPEPAILQSLAQQLEEGVSTFDGLAA